MAKRVDHTGQKFGSVRVVSSYIDPKRNRPYYTCKCDCGKTVTKESLKPRPYCSVTCSLNLRDYSRKGLTRPNVIQVTQRKCRKCGDRLPVNRYFNHAECAVDSNLYRDFDDEIAYAS